MTGAELRRLRERAKLTQEALATLADVHWRTVLRWEAGQVPIPALAVGRSWLNRRRDADCPRSHRSRFAA